LPSDGAIESVLLASHKSPQHYAHAGTRQIGDMAFEVVAADSVSAEVHAEMVTLQALHGRKFGAGAMTIGD